MYFKIQDIKDGTYPVPNLIWILKGNSLTLYSYINWEGEKTELYKAPYPNTRPGVCLGTKGQTFLTQKATLLDPQKIIDAAEHVFWNTAFTEPTPTTVTPHNVLYPKLLNKTSFPQEELIKVDKKLAQIWQR